MSSTNHPQHPDWVGIDHVQMAIPPDGEDTARAFYGDVLGLVEVPKPPALAVRGGAWFEAGSVVIHVGSDPDFVPARKAHPGLTMRHLRDFVEQRGLDVQWNDEIAGVVRCHLFDPFGNRVELIDADTIA